MFKHDGGSVVERVAHGAVGSIQEY